MAQLIIGGVLIVIGIYAFFHTRQLIRHLAEIESPSISRMDKDRITSIVFVYHLIAGLTTLAGLAILALVAAS